MYVIGMNGPPRSGKDTVGGLIADRVDGSAMTLALSMPMRKTIYALLGIEYSVEHYERQKDVWQPRLGGDTIRQAMISLSADFVKPRYGNDFWARSTNALIRQRPYPNVVVITDFGFDSEAKFFTGAYGHNFAIVQLTRPGTDWSIDSRGYVHAQPDRTLTLANDESPEEAADKILHWLCSYYSWDI